tara:strand:- start:345 stop:1109 length:765 start_codon:yes stop_codon:yes gene_type:complete
MSNIIAFAGAKQSGKTTSVNFLHGHEMKSHGFIKQFFIDEAGRLVVNAKYLDDNDKEFESMGVFDVFQESQTFADYASTTFWPFVKAYNFADPLKRLCISLFGLDREQCYGTDEQKNSLTDILWDNVSQDSSGRMTAREFMQAFGTDICRKIKDDVWVSLCIKQIKDENPNLALIGDCRFKNEIDAVHEAGGKVIYFTRNSESSDGHDSEKASEYKDHYDCIIDNTNTSVEEQNKLVLEQIQAWGILPKYIEGI